MPGLQTLVRLRPRSLESRAEVDVRALERKLRQRTSGEVRLSNFLLWQAAYAELIFLDTLSRTAVFLL